VNDLTMRSIAGRDELDPARNDGSIVAHVAGLPERRGGGHVDDIPGEGTRILVAQHAPRIRAATDLGDTPMANAFLRVGCVDRERAITRNRP
jgi:hypothetical protein